MKYIGDYPCEYWTVIVRNDNKIYRVDVYTTTRLDAEYFAEKHLGSLSRASGSDFMNLEQQRKYKLTYPNDPEPDQILGTEEI